MRLKAPSSRESFNLPLIPRANRLQHWLVIQIEKIVDLSESIRMSSPHESVTDQSNIEFLHMLG